MSSAVRLTLVLWLVGAAPIEAQRADEFDDLYREAIRHVQRSEWQPAEEKLLLAQKLGPPSGPNVIRRGLLGRDDYFPEFYLGIVYLNTGRAAAAATQFQVARRRGVDPKDSEFRRLPEFEGRAAAILEAEAAKKAAVPDPKQQFKALMDQAQQALKDSRFEAADAAARQARALDVDNAAADGMVQSIARARGNARLQDELAKSPDLAGLRRLLTEYADAGPALDEVRRRIAAGEALESRAKGERAAMIEFFAGNYQRSIAALQEAEKAMPLSARGTFYRACSLASLATRGKAVNQTQLREARRLYAIAAENAGQFAGDLRFISPRLLEVLKGS